MRSISMFLTAATLAAATLCSTPAHAADSLKLHTVKVFFGSAKGAITMWAGGKLSTAWFGTPTCPDVPDKETIARLYTALNEGRGITPYVMSKGKTKCLIGVAFHDK